MIRSTRAQKAERLSAARRLLADEISMAEAAMTLSRRFGLSRRQAYRYLELARAGAAAPLAAQAVDRARSAQDPDARGDDRAAVTSRLRLGRIAPVEASVGEQYLRTQPCLRSFLPLFAL
jgi:hypothetical protein